MRVHDLYRLLDQRKGKSSISFHVKLLKLAKKKKGKNKIDFLTEREREKLWESIQSVASSE